MNKLISNKQIRSLAIAAHNVEQHAVLILLGLTVGLAFLYIYFLGSAVVHVVERRETQNTIANVSSQIANLEDEYFKRKSNITGSLAVEMNFEPIESKQFVERSRYLGRADIR